MIFEKPTDFTGCTLWLDAQDDDTFSHTQLSPEEKAIVDLWGTGEIKDNPYVFESWKDKGSFQITLRQESYMRPFIDPQGINGKTAVRFDGSDFLELPDNLITFEQFSVFVVGSSKNVDEGDGMGGTLLGSGCGNELGVQVRPDGTALFALGRTTYKQADNFTHITPIDSSAHIFGFQALKGFAEFRLDGESLAVGRCTMTNKLKNMAIGVYKQGRNLRPLVARYLIGHIGEVIFYNKCLNVKERLRVELYLKKRWGLKHMPE